MAEEKAPTAPPPYTDTTYQGGYPQQSPYPATSGQAPPQIAPGYTPVGQNPQIVVAAQPIPVHQPIFRDYPVTITMDNGQRVETTVQYKSGVLTWLICCLVCWMCTAFTGICGFFGLIAFCIKDLKDVYHVDSQGNVVGVYKRLS